VLREGRVNLKTKGVDEMIIEFEQAKEELEAIQELLNQVGDAL